MTKQMAVNLLELQWIALSNPLKKKWLRLYIQELKRQKLQAESGQQPDFQITNYLKAEIQKTKRIFFQKKLWLEICLKMFEELENGSSVNYAPIYLICLQVQMYSTCKKIKIQRYLKLLLKYTSRDYPVPFAKIISNMKSELEAVTFSDRTSLFEKDWAAECKIFLENL